MKNPLHRRLSRELISEFGKYLVIFLLMAGTIGFVSGFLVADGSLITAYEESFHKYNIEDGNFRLKNKANKAREKSVRQLGVTLYENFYAEKVLTNGSTLRIFENREQVNLVCLMKGNLPSKKDEIAIDRMYAENNQLEIGDTLTDGTFLCTITGLVALPDYSCLFSNNNDSMFDSVKFGVAIVTPEGFSSFAADELHYSYSWKYEKQPLTEEAEREMAEEFLKKLNQEVSLEDFIPRYQNQAIQFTGEDMGGDRVMMIVLLYIVIVIMAFVFGVTTSNTISRESTVIGTLRAMGYTTKELIFHYMAAPVCVTLAGAVTGNVLGYTLFKNLCADMYYGSYSLTTYETIWNADAFLMTTAVPLLLMAVINFLILKWKLMLPPLKFLRRDLKRKKQKYALSLSSKIPFFWRFRLRIIFQNLSNYTVLFVGILFANLLLMFGLLFPAVLDHYQDEIENNLLCKYQYLLQMPAGDSDSQYTLESLLTMLYFQYSVETDNEDAEKFSAFSLNTLGEIYKSEEILLYGIAPQSRYINLPPPQGSQVWISSAYAEKYQLQAGDSIRLKEKYEDTEYEFLISGIYEYEGGLAVFMSQEELNSRFDLGEDYFGGYFSDTEITDIDDKYISTVINLESLTKISRQLDVSMGNMMLLVDGFAIIMFMVLIYLLSKIIIEKNSQSISMVKILGYTQREISRLYIVSTSTMVVLFLLISYPVESKAMDFLFRTIMMNSISGWIPFYIDPVIYIKMFLLGIATYGAVAVLEYHKIRRVPMEEVLKNIE